MNFGKHQSIIKRFSRKLNIFERLSPRKRIENKKIGIQYLSNGLKFLLCHKFDNLGHRKVLLSGDKSFLSKGKHLNGSDDTNFENERYPVMSYIANLVAVFILNFKNIGMSC